ncbi:hypothetical protein H5T89_07150 [bacterium]|nr:hypothetical protein [bacterium]
MLELSLKVAASILPVASSIAACKQTLGGTLSQNYLPMTISQNVNIPVDNILYTVI